MFFMGQFYHTLDEKGRLTVPARFRDLLISEGGYIMQGFDQNLMVLPSAAFEAYTHRINQMSLTDPTSRLLRRLLYSTANPIEFDKAGRVLIPQFLRQFAGLDGEVVIVGSGHYFEIWSTALWANQAEELQDAQQNASRFSALNLPSE